MNKKKGILLVSLFLFISLKSFAENDSLCRKSEQILFACQTKNDKLISLCASKDLSATTGYVQYRFGKKNNIELFYPSDKLPPGKAFTGRSQMFSGGGGLYLRFGKNGYDYILYNGIGKGWDVRGLVLLKNSKVLSYFPCINQPVSELTPQQLEDLGIPLDPDNKEFFPGDIPKENNLSATNVSQHSEEVNNIKACFDNAVTTVAMKACANNEYTVYNNLLNKQYNVLLNLLPETRKNLLIDTQKAWLNYRKKECDFESLQNEGGTLQSLSLIECYTTLNKRRISDLNDFIKIYQN